MSKSLLVIDLQNGVGPLFEFEKIIQNVNQCISEFREKGEPIIVDAETFSAPKINRFYWEMWSELSHRSPLV